jgi:hypothetical protein
MESNHLSEIRMRQFMLDSLKLTEDESDHISGWKCAECAQTMRKVVAEEAETASTTPDPSKKNLY